MPTPPPLLRLEELPPRNDPDTDGFRLESANPSNHTFPGARPSQWFCFRGLKVGAEHSQLYVDMGGVGPPSEKNRFSASTASADGPNTHFVHSVADFNNLGKSLLLLSILCIVVVVLYMYRVYFHQIAH